MATIFVVEDLAAEVVAGQGGQAIRVLQVLEGLRRLGHEPIFLEFLREAPSQDSVRYFTDVMTDWWDLDRSALLVESDRTSACGLAVKDVEKAARHARAVITVAAHYRERPWPWIGDVRPRVLFEQDPGFTQIWAKRHGARKIYGPQDVYYTVGRNVGTADAAVPAAGIDWSHMWNPVVMDWWDGTDLPEATAYTTVGDWRGYGYVEWNGDVFGPKSEEFRPFLDLPSRSGEEFELVLQISADDPDRELLTSSGWVLRQPDVVSAPEDYVAYLRASKGEFSCCKGTYAGLNTGWFSDRTAAYLASGRPAVVQATGFEDHLPVGEGLFAVTTVDEAVEAMRKIDRDYAAHSAAARRIADRYFRAETVFDRLLDDIGIA